MSRKTIILEENGVYVNKEMSLEEVLEKFKFKLWQFAEKCWNNTKGNHTNINTIEDYYEEGVIVLIKCFNVYEPQKCFYFYLNDCLENKKKEIFKYYTFKNRETKLNTYDYTLDKKICNNKDENITKAEFDHDFNILLGTLNALEKSIVEEIFIENNSLRKFSEKHNIHRNTLNKRIAVVKEKCKIYLEKQCA